MSSLDGFDPTEYDRPTPVTDADAPWSPPSTNGQHPTVEPFATYGVDDLLSLPTVEWVVDRVIQRGEGTLVYGERGAGKSLVALDLLLHIAADIRWRGRPTRRERVLLVVLENSYAMPERIREWMLQHPDADLREWFRFTVDPMRTTIDDDMSRLHATIEQYRPGIVAVDTWQRFSAGLDENAGKDQQTVVDRLDTIRASYGCTVVMVDHSGKDSRRGTRGHSLKEASFTVVAEVTQSENGLVKLGTQKVNNAATSMEAWQLTVGQEGPYLEPTDAKKADVDERTERLKSVIEYVRAHPMAYRSTIEEDVKGKAEDIRATLNAAVEHGFLVEHKPTKTRRQYSIPVVPGAGRQDIDAVVPTGGTTADDKTGSATQSQFPVVPPEGRQGTTGLRLLSSSPLPP